jgi:hypothetical protein
MRSRQPLITYFLLPCYQNLKRREWLSSIRKFTSCLRTRFLSFSLCFLLLRMFASPGEMRVEARRLGVRVNLPQASWSDNVDDILKKSGALPRKLIVERPPSPVTDPSLLEIEKNSDDIRAPSPIQAEAERSTPQRPNRPRSSGSRQSSELRGGVSSGPRASTDDEMSTAGRGAGPRRDSFVNTRQTIVKFQLFS